jgi:uncharacterized membrane protein YkvA (DUF1232 family)
MKKAKKKAPARKRKPAAPRPAEKSGSTLQSRLESEFSESLKSAKSYVKDPERLRSLVTEAAKRAAMLPKEQFKDTWAYLQAMLRLIRAYYRGEYREVPVATLVIIVAAVIYLINPIDLLPDWIPGVGLLDDAFVLALAVRRTRKSLDDFMAWEIAAS